MTQAKSFEIPKMLVWEAYKCVKANRGAAGVDEQSLGEFEESLGDNLYRIWNRMSSGSYFPPPVRAVAIPKKSGVERTLGIPTVSDRIAQAVVKLMLELKVEPYFMRIPTATDRADRPIKRWQSLASAAGGTTGYWNLT